MGGGTAADTPRVTIAMITHEVPGELVLGFGPQGRGDRGEEGQCRAAVFERSGGA